MIMIDKLAYSSPVREKSPFTKCYFSVGTLLVCVCIRDLLISLVILAVTGYLAVKHSKVSVSKYIGMLSGPLVFLVLGSIAIAFDITQQPQDFLNISMGAFYISSSLNSMTYTLTLIATALGSVSCLYYLALTTPMQDIILVLRALKTPWLLVEITLLMYRFIFVLADMAASIMLSQECRLSQMNLKTKIRSLGMMLSVVLIRSLHKANALYDSMEARCYDGQIRVLWESRKASKKELAAITIFLIMLCILAIII